MADRFRLSGIGVVAEVLLELHVEDASDADAELCRVDEIFSCGFNSLDMFLGTSILATDLAAGGDGLGIDVMDGIGETAGVHDLPDVDGVDGGIGGDIRWG